jgi:hypothetical protein
MRCSPYLISYAIISILINFAQEKIDFSYPNFVKEQKAGADLLTKQTTGKG